MSNFVDIAATQICACSENDESPHPGFTDHERFLEIVHDVVKELTETATIHLAEGPRLGLYEHHSYSTCES